MMSAFMESSLNSCHVEPRLLAAPIPPQCTFLADGIGPLENPVLPGGQARKNFRFHGLGSGETQIRFHAGEAVGRKARALLKKHPDLVVPVDVVEREGDESELLRLFGIKRLADFFPRACHIGGISLKAGLKPRQAMAHGIGTEIESA